MSYVVAVVTYVSINDLLMVSDKAEFSRMRLHNI